MCADDCALIEGWTVDSKQLSSGWDVSLAGIRWQDTRYPWIRLVAVVLCLPRLGSSLSGRQVACESLAVEPVDACSGRSM